MLAQYQNRMGEWGKGRNSFGENKMNLRSHSIPVLRAMSPSVLCRHSTHNQYCIISIIIICALIMETSTAMEWITCVEQTQRTRWHCQLSRLENNQSNSEQLKPNNNNNLEQSFSRSSKNNSKTRKHCVLYAAQTPHTHIHISKCALCIHKYQTRNEISSAKFMKWMETMRYTYFPFIPSILSHIHFDGFGSIAGSYFVFVERLQSMAKWETAK